MSNSKKWWAFWCEVATMWRKEHGLNISLLWKLSPWITLISIVGVVALEEPWKTVAWVFFGIGIIDLTASLCFVFPYVKWSRDIKQRDERIAELLPLEQYKKQQEGNEGDWLYLTVESIDLGQSLHHPKTAIICKFQIDSGLVYDFQPYAMYVSLILDGYEPSEPQFEMKPPPNLLRGQRSHLDSKTITIKDERLLEILNSARQGKPVTKALKVLCFNGSRTISFEEKC
jgi:hypothetical protein